MTMVVLIWSMTVAATSFPADSAQEEYRRLAALENDALAVEHDSSLQRTKHC